MLLLQQTQSLQQRPLVTIPMHAAAATSLCARHAISIAAFEGSDQSTSKKLLPSPGIAATLVITRHAERAMAAREDCRTMTARRVQAETSDPPASALRRFIL